MNRFLVWWFVVTGIVSAPLAGQIVVTVPEEVRSGDAVQVTVRGDRSVERVQLRVTGPDGSVSDFHAFPLFDADKENATWICLFGLGSIAEPGSYDVDVLVENSSGSRIVARSLRVDAREYLSERIAINGTLTRLLASDLERRRREALEMDSVIRTFNPDAIFHLGTLQNPVVGARETSFFGDRRTYRYADGARGHSIHAGWDLAAPTGTPVRAGGDGVVVMVGNRLVTGLSVVVEHLPGVFTLYYHLDTVRVLLDDPVLQGQILGTVGSTGLATGPHLHWELRVGGEPVDPARYLTRPLVDMSSLLGTMTAVSQERG